VADSKVEVVQIYSKRKTANNDFPIYVFKYWSDGCALYSGQQLMACCNLAKIDEYNAQIRFLFERGLQIFELSSISKGKLKVEKRITKYFYRTEASFLKLLQELQKKTVVYACVKIRNENADVSIFNKAKYYGRGDTACYFSYPYVEFISHIAPRCNL